MAVASVIVALSVHPVAGQSIVDIASYRFQVGNSGDGTKAAVLGSGLSTRISASQWAATGTSSSGSGSLASTLDYVDRSGVNFPVAPGSTVYSNDKAITTKSWPSKQELGSNSGVNEKVYEFFTLTPKAGRTFTFTGLTFDVGSGTGNDSVPNLKVEVLKTTGGTTSLLSSFVFSQTGSGNAGFGNGRSFSFPAFDATAADKVEFRFLGYNAAENDSPLYLDNVTARGSLKNTTTPPIPEPSTYAAVFASGLLVYGVGRRMFRSNR